MRTSLRRSCNACVKAKHRCDLQIPQCSRCMKRKSRCLYTNEPAPSRPHDTSTGTSGTRKLALENEFDVSSATGRNVRVTPRRFESLVRLENPSNEYLDPFSVYPATRLPRTHVQRLIHHFLSNIAFQYYPLDLNADSNPFLVSWWPLALQDPALFHVSLQTASLDEEVRAQKGFPISELLMVDSVSLVRRKIEDSSLAFQDETLNSVVTLAAIEHGKGHIQASRMHIDGVKRIVDVRGGIDKVKCSSPLTARMVLWVSLLVTGTPQFQTQDDSGDRTGIGPIPQWHLASKDTPSQQLTLDHLDINPVMSNILSHLRNIFHDPHLSNLTTTELHDLTCYVVHKLLLLPPFSTVDTKQSSTSECLRYALALYMLIIHGTTYYSHVDIENAIMVQLKTNLKTLIWTNDFDSLKLWFISIGMAAAGDTADHQWFLDQACIATTALGLQVWDDVLLRLQSILWIRMQQGALFQQRWEEVLISLKN
ncbi:uncharacterized protein LY89DRAFT_707125 [Mollisia scopiformis]|uniref:Zn(2)-C6 fungal-type domain-containing protein n=1 Tax=Mollisia scopiformis TaxID=149040 RepID=A0A194XBX1_MOLSC|nr:uncharacterized protein LY89DRAFT_707125 [Mollisia scopiformis]KUJ17660.1 hypothetical protein LY89DRAFT_707125 [Mollisia scopiformis]